MSTILGRGLINAQPEPNRGYLYKGEMVGRKLLISSCDPAAVFDQVEEPLDHIAAPIEVRTEADCVLAVLLWRNVAPSTSSATPVWMSAFGGKADLKRCRV